MPFEEGFPEPPKRPGGDKRDRGDDRGEAPRGGYFDWNPFDLPGGFFDRGPTFPVINISPPKAPQPKFEQPIGGKQPFPPPDANPPFMQPVVPYDPYPSPNYPPPGPRPGTPDFNPYGPGGPVIGPIVPFFDVVAVLERLAQYNNILGGVFDVLTGRPQAPIPKGPTNPRGRGPPGRGDPFPRGGPQVIVVQMPPAQPPRQTRDEWLSGGGLGDIYVNPKRLPIPTPPAPRPVPTPTSKYGKFVQPIIGLAGLLVTALTGGTKQEQRQNVNVPDPFGPGDQPDPRLEPQPSVIFGDIGGTTGGGVGSFTCECLPPKKKRRKKKRTVCYKGTYTENRDGTRKIKKRKVPCK